jgi:hypothetical protein
MVRPKGFSSISWGIQATYHAFLGKVAGLAEMGAEDVVMILGFFKRV